MLCLLTIVFHLRCTLQKSNATDAFIQQESNNTDMQGHSRKHRFWPFFGDGLGSLESLLL